MISFINKHKSHPLTHRSSYILLLRCFSQVAVFNIRALFAVVIYLGFIITFQSQAVVILPCCYATNQFGGYCWICPPTGNDFPCNLNQNQECRDCKQLPKTDILSINRHGPSSINYNQSKSDCSACTSTPVDAGMPRWVVSEPILNIHIQDTPLFYPQSRGKIVAFDISYKDTMDQDEATEAESNQSSLYSLGRHWTTNWKRYLKETDLIDCYEYYNGLGGRQILTVASSNAYQDNISLVRLQNGELAILHPGGAQDLFNYANPGDDGIVRYQMTESRDPYGNSISLTYSDFITSGRTTSLLSSITDIDGGQTILTYTNINGFLLINSVTDPYGHIMTLQYDNQPFPNLIKVVDAIGLQSFMTYNDDTGGIATLTTPYTNTKFDPLSDINGLSNRGILITENGNHIGSRSHLFIYSDSGDPNVLLPSFDGYRPSTTNFVSGYCFSNTFDSEYMNQHNTFYWGPSQYKLLPSAFTLLFSSNNLNLSYLQTSNYLCSRMRHWLLTTNIATTESSVSTTISVERGVSRDGVSPGKIVWFDYQGKLGGNPNLEGISSMPSIIAELLPSGDSRFSLYNRNVWGSVTNLTETYGGLTANAGVRSTSFQYSDDGVDLLSIIDALGNQVISNQFNTSHQITSSANALKEITQYTYDNQRRLSSIVYPSGLIVTNLYYPSGNLKEVIEIGYSTNLYSWLSGRSYTITDSRNMTITNNWDALGRLQKVSYPDGSYLSNSYVNLDIVDTIDRLGAHSQKRYDDFRQMIISVDSEGRTNLFGYCDCGELVSRTDASGNITMYSYDIAGNLSRVSLPDNSFVTYKYDQAGRRFSWSDSSGYSVTNSFDNNSNIKSRSDSFGYIFLLGYDILGHITNYVDQNGVQITNSYDRTGRLVTRYYSDRGTVSFGYTYGSILPTSISNYNGTFYRLTFDPRNLLTSEITPALGTNMFSYSSAHDLNYISNNSGYTISFKHDIFGRITNIFDFAGVSLLSASYDGGNHITNVIWSTKGPLSLLYDRTGNITNLTGPIGSISRYSYDPEGNLSLMNDGTGACVWVRDSMGRMLSEDGPWIDDNVSVGYNGKMRTKLGIQCSLHPPLDQTYVYDAVQRVSSINCLGTYGFGWSSIGRSWLTSITYPGGTAIMNTFDGFGRVVNRSVTDSSWVVLDARTNIYNMYGLETLQGFTLGNILTYQYNVDGSIASEKGYTGIGGSYRLQENRSYAYDGFGNLAYKTNGTLAEGIIIGPSGELVGKTNSGLFQVSGLVSTSPASVTVNAAVVQTYADNSFVSPSFSVPNSPANFVAIGVDQLGRRDTNSVTANFRSGALFAYDRYGNLVWDGLHAYDYTAFNQLAQVVAGTSNKVEYTYDGLFRRRITREFTWSGSGTNFGLSTITNLTYPLRNDFSGWVGCSLKTGANPLVISYLGRIVARGNSANHTLKLVRGDGTDCPGGSTVLNTAGLTVGQFGYAPVTNPVVLEANSVYYLLSQETAGGDFWYDLGASSVTSSAAVLGGGVLSPTNSGVYTVTGNSNQTYGPLDFRFTPGSWNLAKETRYLYDGRLVVQERNGQNVPTVSYVRGPDRSGTLTGAAGAGGLLARISHDGSLPQQAYYFSDVSGNVAGMFSPQGHLLANYRYDPFGNLLGMSGPLAGINRYRFSSQEVQPLTGQYDFGFRTYDPSLQRWLTRDPIGALGGWNPYQFVGNNPINRIDRYGLADGTEDPDPFEGSDSYCAELLARIASLIANLGTGNPGMTDGVMLELLMDEWLDKCRNYDTLPTASEECLNTIPVSPTPAPGSRNRSPAPTNPPSTFCSRNPELCVGIGIGIIGIGVGATCLFQPELCAIAVRVGVGAGRGLIPGVVVAL